MEAQYRSAFTFDDKIAESIQKRNGKLDGLYCQIGDGKIFGTIHKPALNQE